MQKHLFFSFLLFTCTLSAQIPMSGIWQTTPYLSISNRFDLLCTSLYGPKHPLTEYISSYRRLINHYGNLIKQADLSSDTQEQPLIKKIRGTLDTIDEHIKKIISEYEVVDENGSTPLTTAQLPIEAVQSGSHPSLSVRPVSGLTPNDHNQSLHNYIGIMQALSPQHYHGIGGEQPANRDDVTRDQVSLLVVGSLVIALFTVTGRYLFGRAISQAKNLQNEQRRMQRVIKDFTYNLEGRS